MSHSQLQENSPLIRDEHLLDRLRLAAIPGLGPILRRRLISQFGSASRVLQQSVESLESIHGIGLRLGKAVACGGVEGGSSLTAAP
jgi:excinuclease UvrABC nuclease subunit